MTNPLGSHCKMWGSVMGDTFLASQKGGESMYMNALEKHQQCLPICLFFPDDNESGKSWNVAFPAWERKAGPSTRKKEIPVLPTTSCGSWKNTPSSPGGCQLPLTWAGGGVWQSIQFQKHADRSMQFREWKQLECYKELTYKTRAIKLGAVCVILANMARGGQKGKEGGQQNLPASVSKEVSCQVHARRPCVS